MIFSIVLSASILLAATQDQPPMELVEAIHTAHQANRALMTRATIRLRFSIGDAPDMSAALAGRWTDRSDADGLFVMDGPRMRYDQLFEPEVMRAKRHATGPMSYSTRVTSVRVVTDGRVTLTDLMSFKPASVGGEPLSRQVRIDPGVDPFFLRTHLPLRPGRQGTGTSFGTVVELLRNGAEGIRLKEVKLGSRLDGVEVAEVAIEVADGTTRFWFDLRRGAVPILERSETNGGKIFTLDRCEDLRQVAGGAWLPFRRVRYTNNGNSVWEWSILEADFDKVPDEGQFRLTLPKAQSVMDAAAMREYPPADVWDLARLPPANAPGVRPLLPRMSTVEPPTMPGERHPTPYASIATVAVGVILVTLAVVFWRRRSRA